MPPFIVKPARPARRNRQKAIRSVRPHAGTARGPTSRESIAPTEGPALQSRRFCRFLIEPESRILRKKQPRSTDAATRKTDMKRDMVVFGEDWGRHPSATQHLVKRLARERTALWVNSIGMRRPRLNRQDMARLFEKARAMARGGAIQAADRATGEKDVAVPDTMRVLEPVAISWPGSKAAARFNRFVLSRQIRRAILEAGMSKPLLWCSLPTAAAVCGTLGEYGTIYYCGDDFSVWQGVDHRPVMAMERRLAERADLVIAASSTLAERFPPEKTLLIEHGVDHSLFASPAPRPPDMAFSGPVAGFFGTIGARVHVDLIADAAIGLPHWNFVMIGPVQTDCSRLFACPNVHFLGTRAHEELPGYVQNWNVSLLPFRQGPDIDAGNPLKMREYLASGTPVAATRFNALKPYETLVSVAESEADYAAAIERAAHDASRNALRRAAVAGESWDEKATRIESALAAL